MCPCCGTTREPGRRSCANPECDFPFSAYERRPWRHLRIVTNGRTYRLQARGVRWWNRWGDLGGYIHGPFWSAKEYATLDDAVAALARAHDVAQERGWHPVDVTLTP